MEVRRPFDAIRHCLVLIVVVAFFGIGSARAEMHTLATFGNWDRSVLILAEGESQGTRLAAIILDRPWPPRNATDTPVPQRIVVVFDKQSWPKFESMWNTVKGCIFGGGGTCPEPSFEDQADGTQVSMHSTFSFDEYPNVHHEKGPVLAIVVTDKDGNYGKVLFQEADPKGLRDMKEAIKKISDYLNPPPAL